MKIKKERIMMKVLRNLAILIVSIGLFLACSTDSHELLLGQWKVVEDYYYETTPEGGEHRISNTETNYVFNFTDDGKVSYTSPNGEVQSWDYILRQGELVMNGKQWDVEILNSRTLQIFIFGGSTDGKPSFYRCQRL